MPAIALGALDTNLLALTSAYAALANGGIFIAPRLFVSVNDGADEELITSPIVEEKVADENAVYVLTNILQGALERGTGKRSCVPWATAPPRRARPGPPGRARRVVRGLYADLGGRGLGWVRRQFRLGLTGASAAAPIWAEFMKCAAPYHEQSAFLAPPGWYLRRWI